MAVTISGKLIGPNGDPRSGVTIQLRAVKTSSAVVQLAPSTSVTGSDGSYSLSVEVGMHEVMIEAFGQPYEKVGTIAVYADSTAGTLNDFLTAPGETELTPAIVATVEEMRAASLAARDETLAARDDAKSYADSAQNAASGVGLKPDKATGLAQTTNGQTFSVAGEPGSGVAVYVYRNDSGTGTLVYTLSSKDAVDAVQATATAVDTRTQGLKTSRRNIYFDEYVDAVGRFYGWVTNKGIWNFPAGVNAGTITATLLNIANIALSKLSVGSGAILNNTSSSAYIHSFEDGNNRVLGGFKNDGVGTPEFLGEPFSHQKGALPNDVFYIGDSITAFTESTTGNYNNTNRDLSPLVCAQGWPIYAELISKGRVKYAGVSATGGFTALEVLNTHVPVAIKAKPSACVVMVGRNDINAATPIATLISTFKKIFWQLRSNGIMPILATMPAQNSNDATKKVLQYNINNWLKSYAQAKKFPLIDLHAATVDPASGEWLTGYWYDVSHPRPLGAKAMGKAVADTLSAWLAPTLPRTAVNTTTAATSDNKIDDPLFYTHDGVNPAGWNITTQGISSISAEAAIRGNAWHLSGGAKRNKIIPVVAGEKIGFGYMLKANDNLENDIYVVSGSDPTGTSYLAGMKRWGGITDGWGYFYKEFIVPDGVTNVTVVISAGGSIDIAQAGMFGILEV